MKTNQHMRILDYCSRHKSITRLEAVTNLGITELPKRISEMRRLGYVFDKEWIEVKNRYGEKTRVKRYTYLGKSA